MRRLGEGDQAAAAELRLDSSREAFAATDVFIGGAYLRRSWLRPHDTVPVAWQPLAPVRPPQDAALGRIVATSADLRSFAAA
jgi:hypothetical protein